MSDDLVKQLRFTADDVCRCGTSVCLEAADRIEKLEAELVRTFNNMMEDGKRIEKLEAALRSIAANACCDSCREAALVARKALEGKE